MPQVGGMPRMAPQPVPAMAEPERAPMAAVAEEQQDYAEAAVAARPVQPQPRPIPQPRQASRFAEPRVGAQRSGMFAEAPKSEPPPARRTIFGIVTGAIRGTPAPAPVAEAPAPVRQEPTQAEPARAHVRTTVGEEMGIEIPAFLRRQSS